MGEWAFGVVSVAAFVQLSIAANFALLALWWLLPPALALWVTSQIRLRRLLGIGWNPLLASLGELAGRPG